MKSGTLKFVTWAVIAALIAFAGFQIYQYFYGGYHTETAYTYEVSDSILTHGVMLREERPLDIQSDRVVEYAVAEGGKVKNGTVLANTYATEQEARQAREARRNARELELLTSIRDNVNAATVRDAENLTAGIIQAVRGISLDARYGRLEDVEEKRLRLEEYLNRRNMITGDSAALEARIAALRGTDAAVSGTEILSNAAGYFSRYVDGQEGALTPKLLDDATSAEIAALAEADYPYDYSAFGKVVSDYRWCYAAVVSLEDAALFPVGGRVNMTFIGSSGEAISALVQSVEEDKESGSAVLCLSGETMNSDTISRRSASVLVSLSAKKGVRFPQKALRIVDGVRGVYVDQGYRVAFKRVDIIYTGKDFYISRTDTAENSTDEFLCNFDEIIVGGTDLYDGKPLLS